MGSQGRGALGASPDSVAHNPAVCFLFERECLGRTKATLALWCLTILFRFTSLRRSRGIHECVVARGSDSDSTGSRGEKYLAPS